MAKNKNMRLVFILQYINASGVDIFVATDKVLSESSSGKVFTEGATPSQLLETETNGNWDYRANIARVHDYGRLQELQEGFVKGYEGGVGEYSGYKANVTGFWTTTPAV